MTPDFQVNAFKNIMKVPLLIFTSGKEYQNKKNEKPPPIHVNKYINNS